MAIRIKPIATLQDKFSRRAQAAAPEYTDGVKNPKRDQADAAVAAAPTWAAGVQQAIADNRFAKGVQAVGSAKWAGRAQTVGAQRFGPGVAAAAPDWGKATAPFLNTLASLDLPPRSPKGDPSNIARVSAVATALRAQKLAQSK